MRGAERGWNSSRRFSTSQNLICKTIIRVHIYNSLSNCLPCVISFVLCFRYVSEKESRHYRSCNSEQSKSIRLWSEGNEEVGAVKKTNKYIDIESSYSEKNEQSNRNTSYITITRALTVVVRLTLLVLYLYMVWSFINN